MMGAMVGLLVGGGLGFVTTRVCDWVRRSRRRRRLNRFVQLRDPLR